MNNKLYSFTSIEIISKLVFFLLLSILTSCGAEDDQMIIDIPCYDTNCSDYTSQASAQAAFNADPECRSDLDADNDGIACEELGNSVTICPTTANCGCSGLNKSPCQNNVCCKWVVGSGCECS